LSERGIDLVDACGGSQIGVEGRSEDIRERGGSAALLLGFIGSVLPAAFPAAFPVHPLLVAAIFAITTTTGLAVRRPQVCERIALAQTDRRRRLHRVEAEDIPALCGRHLCI
jgi:hypothetical protein